MSISRRYLAAVTGGWGWSPAIFIAAATVGTSLAFVLRRLERRGFAAAD